MIAEHDTEPVAGLPGPLPSGERLLAQCRPSPWAFARSALGVHWVVAWFVVLAVYRTGDAMASGTGSGGLLDAAGAGATPLALGAVAVALLGGIGWWMARATIYTVTNRRVVFRIGVALPVTVNVPFKAVESAGFSRGSSGTGNIALRIVPGQRLSWLVLWPHVRTWRLARPEAMLRAVPEVEAVATVLGEALRKREGQPESAFGTEPSGAPVQGNARAEEVPLAVSSALFEAPASPHTDPVSFGVPLGARASRPQRAGGPGIFKRAGRPRSRETRPAAHVGYAPRRSMTEPRRP